MLSKPSFSVQILSDLHLEFLETPDAINTLIEGLIPKNEVDMMILAGDITSRSKLAMVLERLSKYFRNVLYIPGNHDFYGTSFSTFRNTTASINSPGVYVLDNSSVEIHGRCFVGSILWFRDDPLNPHYCSQLSDFHRIDNFTKLVYDENHRCEDFLRRHVKKGDIVITHHLPSERSVADRFKGSPLNRFFVCEMDDLILEREPLLWIHGHSHDSCDYMIGNTRIICNPFGYPSIDENPEFNPGFVVEMGR